jgi:predicted RNA binding protein YcfA (HicA-like mRNA interferase family)
VTVPYTRGGNDLRPGTSASMIRQSGLPKKLFRR